MCYASMPRAWGFDDLTTLWHRPPVVSSKTKRYSTTLWLFFLPDIYFAEQRSRQCNSSAYGQNNIVLVCIHNMVRIVIVYGTRCTSYVHIVRIVRVYNARHMLSYIFAEQFKKRQQENGVLGLAPSQGSDSGETPHFVGFSNLGNIVGQR